MSRGAKYTHAIHVRITEEQYRFLERLARVIGGDISDAVRFALGLAKATLDSMYTNNIATAIMEASMRWLEERGTIATQENNSSDKPH